MEISNGNNFYMIEQNNILFWGMDIPIREIIISKFLREFIDKNDFYKKLKSIFSNAMFDLIIPFTLISLSTAPNHCTISMDFIKLPVAIVFHALRGI
jgi:hypothetical protein